FLAAVEVDVDQQQSCFDARDVERQHAGRMNIKSASGINQCIPNFDRVFGRDPDLVAEVAGVAGSRNLDRHICDGAFSHTKVLEVCDVGVFDEALEEPAGSGSLQSKRGNAFGDVLDLNVHAGGVLCEPAQARIRCGPAIGVLLE